MKTKPLFQPCHRKTDVIHQIQVDALIQLSMHQFLKFFQNRLNNFQIDYWHIRQHRIALIPNHFVFGNEFPHHDAAVHFGARMLLEADSFPQQDTLLSPFVDSQHDVVIDDTADPKTLAAHSVTSFSTQSAGTIARKMGRKKPDIALAGTSTIPAGQYQVLPVCQLQSRRILLSFAFILYSFCF